MMLVRMACVLMGGVALCAASPEWESLEKAGRWKVLRYQVETKAKTVPKDGEVLIWRSKTLQVFGRTEEAYNTAKEAVKVLPQSADAWAQLGNTCGDMAGKAGMLKQMSYGMECKDAAQKALELNPKHPMGLRLMAGFYEQAPSIVGGDKAKAKACRATLASVDQDFAVRLQVSEAYKTKDPAKIEAALKQAIQTLPNAAWPLVSAASGAMDPKALRILEAQGYARKALELDPFNTTAYGVLAQAQAAEWKWNEVDATLARAEKAVPENLNPHYQTARWLVLASREPKRAEALLRRYLAVEPEAGTPSHGGARWRLGLALEQQGRKAEALQELKLAAQAAPKDKDIAADLKRLGG